MHIIKSEISASFSRAAKQYDSAAILQNIVGKNLLQHIKKLPIFPDKIIDIGSGTGILTQKIKKQFPTSCLLAIDIAHGMLKFSDKIYFICSDADSLPIKSQSIDLVFSNFMLQWSPNLSQTLEEVNRIIIQNGYFIFSTLGRGTLKEWQYCWESSDSYPHVHEFNDSNTMEKNLKSAGFSPVFLKTDYYQLKFKSLRESLDHTRKIGAGNLHSKRQRGLMGKNKFRHFIAEYKKFRDIHGNFPVTYEVITVICKK
jgi:malonyl-CoA O-methyltransferase